MAWHLIKQGGPGEEFGYGHKEFILDSAADISTEPTEYGNIAPGSIAHTAGYAYIWEKDFSGEWQAV